MEDIGDWLNVPASGRKSFGQEFRPVKVDIKVLGFPKSKNDYLFDNNLNFKLLDLIKTYSSGKPSLVVCRVAPNHRPFLINIHSSFAAPAKAL